MLLFVIVLETKDFFLIKGQFFSPPVDDRLDQCVTFILVSFALLIN